MVRMLRKALKHILNEDELKRLYSAIDIVGEIAIIKISNELLDKKQIIGNAILNNVKHIRSVYLQTSAVKGVYRIRELECIAGIDNPITIYKEHGCRFLLDVKRVYFSPRLSTERARLASLANEGDVIVNMFAGIGTFSIIIAKKKTCKIYSIDINPDAHRYAIENVRLNKVEDRVIPILADAHDAVRVLGSIADRVIMPLPEYSKEFIDDAILLLKEHGTIHYFTHIHANNREDAINTCYREIDNIMTRDYKISGIRVVRDVGPRLYQLVADINV